MHCATLLVCLCVLQFCKCDWVSEWMAPVQGQLIDENLDNIRRSGSGNNAILKKYEDEYEKMVPILNSKEFPLGPTWLTNNKAQSVGGLRLKLQTTLANAKVLADALKKEIADITAKEIALKDAISQGRNGMSTITVSILGQLPRKYFIREGIWTLCTGMMQPPVSSNNNAFNAYSSPARCLGQEVTAKPDPCVFHSVIKYETIPTRRRLQYIEDDFLCLKPTFNNTLEQYMSVPRRLINETCANGMVRSVDDNMIECSMRVLSEYNYYPIRGFSSPDLPLEYCTEEDGSCKLLVGWHVSNTTIENFEFLKNEPSFKKYFMKSNSY